MAISWAIWASSWASNCMTAGAWANTIAGASCAGWALALSWAIWITPGAMMA